MKKNLKHLLALCLTIALVFSLAACGQKADETPNDTQNDQQTEQEEFTPASYSIAALKGPTAMGLVKLMKDSESGETTGNEYTFTLAGSAWRYFHTLVPALTSRQPLAAIFSRCASTAS